MSSKKFPGKFSSLEKISKYVASKAEAAGLGEKDIYSVQLAVDEACTNIIEHAYGGEGNGEIECVCEIVEDGLEITLKDEGESFDPESLPELVVGAPIEQLKARGAGVFLIRKLMDEVLYEFIGGQGTVLKMKKKKSG